MTQSAPDNRRIARNATMLTIRMVTATIVGLYTSRVVLEQLGVSDYGIYGVAGGLIGFMAFLTAAMAGGISRFITYALGTGDNDALNRIFNSAILIQAGVAVLVIAVGETGGLWMLYNVLNIPPERMTAAFPVFQFAVVSMAAGIMQVPYTSVLMAYERMGVYATIELVNVGLKLGAVYLLCVSGYDKLVSYAFLCMATSICVALTYGFYCRHNFGCCRLRRISHSGHLRQMLKFSTMDLYGNLGVTVSMQGIVLALNIFFGVTCNAAAALALTVCNTVMALGLNISSAFKPQIIKQYAAGNIAAMQGVMRNSATFTLLATAVVAVPCMLEAEYVLHLWLGQVPRYSVAFVRLIMVTGLLEICNNVANSAIHATGDIRRLSYINGSFYYLIIPAVFAVLWCGADATWAYVIQAAAMTVITVSAVLILKRQIPEFSPRRFAGGILLCFAIIILPALPAWLISVSMEQGPVRVAAVTACYAVITGILARTSILGKENSASLPVHLRLAIPFRLRKTQN